MSRVIGFFILAFVIFFIVTNPRGAASVVRSIGYIIWYVATGLVNFFVAVAA